MKKETFEMPPESIAKMVVNSHEKHYAMIIPTNALYILAKALLAANSQLANAVQMPENPHPAALYALWAHRQDMRGSDENAIAAISYKRLRQLLTGTAQPQREWERVSEYGFKSKDSAGVICCEPTAEMLELLRRGDCTPEELWGIGGRPSCPKCVNKGK